MAASLTGYDLALITACKLIYNNQKQQKFQFPPKITSDDSGLEWNTTSGSQYTGEILTPKGIKNRTLKLEWIYIPGFAGWSVANVQEQVRTFRGYPFSAITANPQNKDGAIYAFAVDFAYPGITGNELKTVALSDLSVKYADTMFYYKENANGVASAAAFPTKVDCSCTVKLWYNPGASVKVADGAKQDPNAQPDLEKLKLKSVDFTWY
jgi:hypothetical protein